MILILREKYAVFEPPQKMFQVSNFCLQEMKVLQLRFYSSL